MKGPGHLAAFFVQTIKNTDGAVGIFCHNLDAMIQNSPAGGFGHKHSAGIPRTDYQDVGVILYYIGDVCLIQPVPLLAPPVTSNMAADDFHIAVIGLTGDLNEPTGFILFYHASHLRDLFFPVHPQD